MSETTITEIIPHHGYPSIELVQMDEQTRFGFRNLSDNYTFREDRPAQWLQRICIGILKRLNCIGGVKTVETTIIRVPIKGPVFEKISRMLDEMRWRHDMKPGHIYIGAEDFRDLMDNLDSSQLLTQAISFECQERSLLGVRFTILPWMRGILPVPARS